MNVQELEEEQHGQSGVWAYGGLYASTREAEIACGLDTPEALAEEEEYWNLRNLTVGSAFWLGCDCAPLDNDFPF